MRLVPTGAASADTALVGTAQVGAVLAGTAQVGAVLAGTAQVGAVLAGAGLAGTGLAGTALVGTALVGAEQIGAEQAGELQLVPVLPALRGLVPGLRRGQVVTVDGAGVLPLALAAGATASGSWCAVVGMPDVGMRAAQGLGMDLDRVVLVSEPGDRWADVTAALVGAAEVVLLRPPVSVSGLPARRLVALARRHGSALVVCGQWEGAQTRLRVASSLWTGVRDGRGYVQGRRVRVEVSGRGAGARPRSAWLWLPGSDGAVATADLESAG